jgi:NADPH:quinone reductase-like Zn-dependent oxidoreductase
MIRIGSYYGAPGEHRHHGVKTRTVAQMRTTTMKAIVQHQYGSSDVLVLEEVDSPTIGDGDVLVRVHAAGLHIGDWHVMTGQPYLMRVMGFGFRAPKARVRGMDVAGTVEAVGKDVSRFQAGMVGNRPLSQLRRVLTAGGTLVVVGGEGGGRWIGGVGRSLRALAVSPFVRQRLRMLLATANVKDLQVLKELIEAAKVRPVIDRTYPLGEMPEAMRSLETGRARGKIVITVRGADRAPAHGTSAWAESHPVTA